ncbi:MAG: flavin monoamine oxidase [Novosphingobium sp. 63-713]|uniref:flavin monoamine oxidase family protein n=2 Tax=Novosphingobium TaxID=165696 RepID=UPI00096152F2|nr:MULTISPECIES: flavin monoamine oxidase family protein [unclassified Novosphingobium]MBN9144675.1 flavin monoamine oxidase family protein [Novosphingobium sp.]MDR6708282.1 monoamine oxidase [Novosphingobium sp. 1748]OJX92375.1 MAG: flavin monoamine oxidase [Novosphingobium sp. 63-713]
MNEPIMPMTKRDLLSMIGTAAGASAMYMAMSSMDQAKASDFKGPPKLEGDNKGASVLILGAGVAGMTAALELSRAGYKVQVLEYNDRVGGRSWTLQGGDTYTELGGATQTCRFAPGNYINPGPWRIPWHHHGLIHYCHELGVALEPFMQVNYNAYVHNTKAFGGKPQRYRHIQADFYGHVGELLARSVNAGALAQTVSKEDGEILLEALRSWGALDRNMRYVKGAASSGRRGYDKEPGGGLSAVPEPSDPIDVQTLLRSGLWRSIGGNLQWDHLSTIFQPVGGMGQVAKGFERAVGHMVRKNSKVTAIHQDEKGVIVTYKDTKSGAVMKAAADYCLCTIPLPVLAQIEMNVSPELDAAIRAVPYSTSVKVGLEFKRRFWEQDDQIYGGITYTDLPMSQISYPSTRYGDKGPGVLLGCYVGGAAGYELTASTPAQRVEKVLEWGSQIHPQYRGEFMNGVSVAWHRVPFTLGCFGSWTEQTRAEHYKNLCKFDGRILLAGEHASYYGGWQEGGITSAIDAITRLHQRVIAG